MGDRMALHARALVAAVVLLTACGGGGSEPDDTAPPPPPSTQGFAGTYATQVTLVQNTCGSVTVQSLPTTVTHELSTGAVTFVHGGTTYSGTVATDSSFTTTP